MSGVAPAFLGLVFVQVMLTGITKGNFGLPPVNSFAGAVPVGILVPPNVVWTVRQAAPFAPSVKGVRTLFPPTKPQLIVAVFGFFAPLDFRSLGRILAGLALVC